MENIIKTNYALLKNSFKKINIKFFLILLYDAIFYFIVVATALLFSKILQIRSKDISFPGDLTNIQETAEIASSLQNFFILLIFLLILYLFLMILNWSIFKGLIWSTTANKKPTIEFIKNFLKLNLIWLPLWVIIIFLLAAIAKQAVAPIYILSAMAIAFYFTNILYPLFLKKSRLKTIKEAFKLGLKKLHHFIIPYLIIIVLFFIVTRIFILISAHQYIFYAAVLAFATWMRFYFVEIVSRLSK